jgi:hypothetical protein
MDFTFLANKSFKNKFNKNAKEKCVIAFLDILLESKGREYNIKYDH